MYSYFSAHSRYNVLATGAIERNDNGNTLTNFRKVSTGRVLIGQQGELTCCRLHDEVHVAGETGITIGIDVNIDGLAFTHIIDSIFIDVGEIGRASCRERV